MEPVAIAYVPVLHQGYKKFFSECVSRGAHSLFLLGHPFTDSFSEIQRDLRALHVEEIRAMIKIFPFFHSVEVLTLAHLPAVRSSPRVFLPNEDVSRDFSDRYLAPEQAEFLSVFLRYDMRALSEKRVPKRHRAVAVSAFDREIMFRARDEAKKSPDWWRQIGAIAVADGKVLCEAFNEHLPNAQTTYAHGDPRSNFTAGEQNEFYCSLHAEQRILAHAARKEGIGLEGAWLYVTTFPCAICARALSFTGIARLYYAEGYATLDADEILVRAGIEVVQVDVSL